MKNIDWDRDATSTAFDLTTFKKQSEAFKYADRVNIARSARNERPMLVFPREISNEGHRYYIVDNVDSFYEKYIRMGARDRTFYEIIRGSLPSRLYFDIEFDAILNPNADGEKSMTIFKTVLYGYIEMMFGYEVIENLM